MRCLDCGARAGVRDTDGLSNARSFREALPYLGQDGLSRG